jgi:hypothetical protein
MSTNTKAILIGFLVLAAFLVAGTNDMQDEQAQEKLTAEIIAAAPGWAVTK